MIFTEIMALNKSEKLFKFLSKISMISNSQRGVLDIPNK